ncbi:MAG: NADH-quinone oxidoreductase subunit N [Actinobacteria bacterium]|nr:NADH-quinone oxidoreductase subunit N [Actinomycetota bacterium]
MSLLASLAAQAAQPVTPVTSVLVETPSVDWWGLLPLILLAAPAMVLLHASSLLRRVFRGFYATASVGIAGTAAAFAIVQWFRVTDLDGGRGPYTTVASAYTVDGYSVFITVVLCVAVIVSSLVADGYLRREGLDGAETYALLLLSASGGVVMASANDLIVLFLGLEVLSIPVYVLAASHLRRSASQEAGFKYFILGAFASAFFLYGIALVYGATGSTNLGTIRQTLQDDPFVDGGALLLAGAAFLLVGFGFKVAAVPFHAWTPDVYQGAPSPVVSYMASGVKAAGFAGLVRVFDVTLAGQVRDWQPIVVGLAVLTLLGGSVLAVAQTDVKRMLAYSSISHAGFLLVGVAVASPEGAAAVLFYLAAYGLMIGGTFAVVTAVAGPGEQATGIDAFRGLGRRQPMLALGFTVLLFAQTGVPLTSGFFAKFGVIKAAVDGGWYWLAAVAMLSAVVGAFVYLRLVVAMFMVEDIDPHHGDGDVVAATPAPVAMPAALTLALAATVVATLVVGFLPGLLTDLAGDAVPVVLATLP